jgi:hypothetical protein
MPYTQPNYSVVFWTIFATALGHKQNLMEPCGAFATHIVQRLPVSFSRPIYSLQNAHCPVTTVYRVHRASGLVNFLPESRRGFSEFIYFGAKVKLPLYQSGRRNTAPTRKRTQAKSQQILFSVTAESGWAKFWNMHKLTASVSVFLQNRTGSIVLLLFCCTRELTACY